MTTVTPAQRTAGVHVVLAVGQAIRAAGRLPSGHLYAVLMDRLSADAYAQVIHLLVQAGCVREEHDELIWIGPAA